MSPSDRLYGFEIKKYSFWKRQVIRLAQFLGQVFSEFNKDYCIIRASGLAFTFLLALVPLLAITFSLFTGFSAFASMKDAIQKTLFQYFIPTMSDQILEYINQFMANTKALGFIGMLFLLVTSVMLFQNIEKTLNDVWNVVEHRKFHQRFIIFTSVLVWGAIFLGASFFVTGKLRVMFGFDLAGEIGFFARQTLSLFPLFLSIAAFVLVMAIVPSTKVRWKSALVGGVVGGLLWEIGKRAFAHYASGAVSYSVIYGSLALIPIFLIWLYLTWIIVLLATEVTYVHQNFHALLQSRTYGKLTSRDRILLTLQILLLISRRFQRGEGPTGSEAIRDHFPVPVEIIQEILYRYGVLQRFQIATTMSASLLSLVSTIYPVSSEDIYLTLQLFHRYAPQGIKARDLIHVAVMKNNGLTKVISADKHFDLVDGITRLDPKILFEEE